MLRAKLDSTQAAGAAGFTVRLDSLAPPPPRGPRGFGGFGGGAAAAPPTLQSVSNALLAAAMAMQQADVAPTAAQLAAADRAKAQYATVMASWSALKARSPSP